MIAETAVAAFIVKGIAAGVTASATAASATALSPTVVVAVAGATAGVVAGGSTGALAGWLSTPQGRAAFKAQFKALSTLNKAKLFHRLTQAPNAVHMIRQNAQTFFGDTNWLIEACQQGILTIHPNLG